MCNLIVTKGLLFLLTLSAYINPFGVFAQESEINLTYNGGMEQLAPFACPRWQSLSRGLPSHIDYNANSGTNFYPNHRVLGWFGTHTEFVLSESLLPVNCNDNFTWPSKVPGVVNIQTLNNMGMFPSFSNGPVNNVFARVYSGWHHLSYRTEYLNGELQIPLYKGIRYETSFDFAHNPSPALKIGFKKLSILFYDKDLEVADDINPIDNFFSPGSIQSPYVYALPPIDTSFDAAPIDWGTGGVVRGGWSLTDDVSYWANRQAGLHIINKELAVDSNGQQIPDVWGNPTYVWDPLQEKYLFQAQWEKVKNHSTDTKYYVPQIEGQDTFTAGVFYQHREYDSQGNDIGYNNPSNSLDQPGGHTGTTNFGRDQNATTPPLPGDSHTASYYYDNFTTYCKSDPMFKLIDSQYADINNGEFNKGYEGREIELKCGDELDFKALYQNSYPKENGFVANYKFYRWSIEGINNSSFQLYTPIELDYNDISNLYSNAPVQSLFDLPVPNGVDLWGNHEFYLGMESTCLPLSYSGVSNLEKWTRFDNSEKLHVKVKAPQEDDIKIVVEGGMGNEFETTDGYIIKINRISQSLKDFGLDVRLEGYENYNQVEILWSIFRLNDDGTRQTKILDEEESENLWLKLNDISFEPTLGIVGGYEIVAKIKIGKNCFKSEKSFFLKVIVEENHHGDLKAEDLGIYAPNAFSPNADGANDIYQFFTSGANASQFRLKKFLVFARWGDLVHERKGSFDILDGTSYGWDGGFHRSNPYPVGVYVYFAVFEHAGKEYTIEGEINLLR